MSGPASVPDWPSIARALGASGCDLTEYGAELAASDLVTCPLCASQFNPAHFTSCPYCESRKAVTDRHA